MQESFSSMANISSTGAPFVGWYTIKATRDPDGCLFICS